MVLAPWIPFGATSATVASTLKRTKCYSRLHFRFVNGMLHTDEHECSKHMYARLYKDRVAKALGNSGVTSDFELLVSLGDSPEVSWDRAGGVTPLTHAPLLGATSDPKHMLTVPFVWQDPRHPTVEQWCREHRQRAWSERPPVLGFRGTPTGGDYNAQTW